MSLDTPLKVTKYREKPIMKRRAPAIGREALAAEIVRLSKLDIEDLRDRWKAMFGKAPSRDISRSFPDARDRVSPPGNSFGRSKALDPTPVGRARP
jgi:hypothetical protein